MFLQEGSGKNLGWHIYDAKGNMEKGSASIEGQGDFDDLVYSEIYCLQEDMSCIAYSRYGGNEIRRLFFEN